MVARLQLHGGVRPNYGSNFALKSNCQPSNQAGRDGLRQVEDGQS